MLRVQLEFIEIVEDRVIFSVYRSVVGQTTHQSILSVVSSNNDALWKIHDALTKEFVVGVKTDDQLWHQQSVVCWQRVIVSLLISLISCTQNHHLAAFTFSITSR